MLPTRNSVIARPALSAVAVHDLPDAVGFLRRISRSSVSSAGSSRCFSRLAAGESLSLGSPRESNQREDDPGCSALRVRVGREGFLTVRPVLAKTSAHPCADPCGPDLPTAAAENGGPTADSNSNSNSRISSEPIFVGREMQRIAPAFERSARTGAIRCVLRPTFLVSPQPVDAPPCHRSLISL